MAQRWDEVTGVVTPEAVRLQFQEANVGSRFVALCVDWLLLGTMFAFVNVGIGYLLSSASGVLPTWVPITVLLLANFLLFFGYPIGFETFWGGKTPGKSAVGLRVVTVEGAPIAFRHAAIRAALGLVDFFMTLGVAAVLATLLSKRSQRLGDMVAGTVVLRERTASRAPAASQFLTPAGAESYAVTLDPSGLAPRDYEAVREFLLRAQTLPVDVRRSVGTQLARALAVKLAHAPPPSVSPELFLSCLAARYQERQWNRAAVPVTPPPSPPAAAEPSSGEEPETQWGDFTPPA